MSNANGYGAPEVWQPYARAQELCARVGDIPQMFPILGGLFFYHAMRADYGPCLETTEHLLELAKRLHDDGATVLGHWGVCTNHLFQGRLKAAQQHAEAGWAVYGRLDDRSLAPTFNIDPGPCCADWGAWIYWLRGYPDQAEEWSREAIAAAYESAHPFTIVTVLVHSGLYYYFRGDPQMALERGRAANRVCDEVGFPLRKAEADICEGWGLVELGQAAEGIPKLEAGLSTWRQLGTEIGNPFFFAMLALAYQRSGRRIEAKAELQRALDTASRNNEHQWEAELHRLNGVFKRDAGEPYLAVDACFKRAVEVAKSQGAKILELRASTSLATSLLAQGRKAEAYHGLAPIHDWFTEGFATKDLTEAKALLQELA
jgi:predicted ATPase